MKTTWISFGGSLAALACGLHASAQNTTRVSESARGQAASAQCYWPNISRNNRYVTFTSEANNLLPMGQGFWQTYLLDRLTGTLETVSLQNDGQPSSWGALGGALSDDGRYVVYAGAVSPAIAGIVVRDRVLQVTRSMQVLADGTHVPDNIGGIWGRFAISSDGRYVAYDSMGLLLPGDTTTRDVFLHDRDVDNDGEFDEPGAIKTIKISASSAGTPSNGESRFPHMSPDGRFIVFVSYGTNLVADDTNGQPDVFLHDRDADHDGVFDEEGAVITERISVRANGQESVGSERTSWGSVSADGRFVSFHTDAADLVSGDTNTMVDIFVRDRQAGTLERINLAPDGTESDGFCTYAQMTDDARYITYLSKATNLLANDTNGAEADMVIHDRMNRSTKLVSHTAANAQGDGLLIVGSLAQFNGVAVSSDGRYLTFISGAEDMAAPPSAVNNAYLRDRGANHLANVDGDGGVSVSDLLEVIGQWGPCPGAPASCAADLNGDHSINVSDLLLVIANWG